MLDDPGTAGWVAAGGAVVAVVAIALAVGAHARMTRVRRALRLLRGQAGDGDVLDLVSGLGAELAEQRRQLEAFRGRLDETRLDVAASLRHVAVVRHPSDRSIAAAVLDDAGDGLIITSADRQHAGQAPEPAVTVKALVHGRCEPPLSDDERRAVLAASSAVPPNPSRGRR